MRLRFRHVTPVERRVPRRPSRHGWIPDSDGVFADCLGELALIAERRSAERSA